MKEHFALEAELEKALREDPDGSFLKELQSSLREYAEAVDRHTRTGLDAGQYRQWGDLRKAAGIAAQVAEEVHQRMHDN
jgi:hypothetical protein